MSCQGCFLCVIDCAYQAVAVTIELSSSARQALISLQGQARGADRIRTVKDPSSGESSTVVRL